MFIEDEELRSLYEAASAEHIEAIEAGLLQLEKTPTDASPLKMLLREAHSLKGDSRMLGVLDAEQVVHQMEEILIAIDQNTLVVTAELCDRLYQGLDAVNKIAQEAITGQSAQVDVAQVVALLGGAGVAAPAVPELDLVLAASSGLPELPLIQGVIPELNFLAEAETDSEIAPDFSAILAALQPPEESPLPPASIESLDLQFLQSGGEDSGDGSLELDAFATFTSEVQPAPIPEPEVAETATAPTTPTVKVEASRLDRLSIQADELAVAKLRMAQRHEELLELYRLWEDWSRLVPSDHPQAQAFSQLLSQLRLTSAEDTNRLTAVADDLENGIRQMRMLPLQSIFGGFPRLVRDLSRQQNKAIDFVIAGGEVLADKQILEALKDPLTHILRNAVDHGIESISDRGGKPAMAHLALQCRQIGSQVEILVQDDGRGLDLEAIRQTALRRGLRTATELAQMSEEQIQLLIFAPGFSTRSQVTEISGRGVGLDVARDKIEQIKGSIRVESSPGKGCSFRILLNNSLATINALILRVGDQPYALPIDNVETMVLLDREAIINQEQQSIVHWQGRGVAVVWLADLLGAKWQAPDTGSALGQRRQQIPCIFVKVEGQYLGILVDELLEQQQIVVKNPNRLLQSVRNLTGASILGNGEICLVLNTLELFQAASGQPLRSDSPGKSAEQNRRLLPEAIKTPQILLVEDSIPIRTQVQRILLAAGYQVTTAVDGADGFQRLLSGDFDGVVSDIEMPNLSGLEMTEKIRQLPQYQDLPIVLVSTLAKPEQRQHGLNMGASAYLSKGDFDQSLLLQTLSQLVKP